MAVESRTTRSLKNIIAGVIFKITGILFPFIIKIVMIKQLGVEYLGLNSLFTSILMVLSLSELGIGSALVYNMYKPIAEGDDERVCALLKIYRNIYYAIGGVITVVGLILLPFLRFFISGKYPSDINIYVLYIIFLFNTVISYYCFAYKKSLWEANQRNGTDNFLASIISVCMYVMQILAMITTKNYYVYISIMPICTIAQNLLRNYLVNKMYPQYKCRGTLEKGFGKKLFIKVRALLGHKIGYTVLAAADSIVISSFLGLKQLAIYSNYYQIINSLIGLLSVVFVAITASVGNSIITSNKKKIYENFSTLNLLGNWLVGWVSICLICLYQPFMRIWMGKSMMFPNYIVLLFVVYFHTTLFGKITLTYKDAAGMWEQDFWKPYIGSLVNIIVNISLCIYIGVEGVLISTILVMVFIYFPWESAVVFKQLFRRSMKEYYSRMLLYTSVVIGNGAITYFLCSLLDDTGLLTLIIKALICLVIPNVVFLLVYYRLPEFKDSKERFKDIIRMRMSNSRGWHND